MSQPNWVLVAQLGDVNPLDCGGYWVLRDTTGAYPEEAELLVVDESDENSSVTAYRFILERCTYVNGILSDNQFHPDHPAWFAAPESRRKERPQDTCYLSNVASSAGRDEEELIADLCSEDAVRRAMAYRDIADYHGAHEFDQYPLTLTRQEAERRYAQPQYV